ncbi:MAG: hypothetical protein ACP5I4_02870 [Oceanipulchritudo sp.]
MVTGYVFASMTLLGQVQPLHETGGDFADNLYVHQWIANEAFRYFSDRIEGSELGTYLGTIEDSFGTTNANLLEGTYAEDANNRDPLYQFMPYNRHFCAGADGSELDDGFLWYPSATTQAENIWDNYMALDYPANRPRAYYRLGHVVHLLADMTVPAHVHNDEHAISEPYENAIGAGERFKLYFFGCTRAGLDALWTQPVGLNASSLRDLFHRTANYTEDYDSGDANGDVTDGSPPYDPGDYPTTWHRPQEVSRAGGMSDAEITITADDLMPYAIRRTAELYRLFYREFDPTLPVASVNYPNTADPASPEIRDSLEPFDLTATAIDPESGILKLGYQFLWSHWDGAAWSEWTVAGPAAGGASTPFSPPAGTGLYAFQVLAENGGGRTAPSPVTYLRIQLPPTPLQAWLDDWGAGLPEEDRAPLGDMNHDGLNNFLTYVAGGNPTLWDGIVPLRMLPLETGPCAVLRLRGDDPHLLYQLQASDDMAAWVSYPVAFVDGLWLIQGSQVSLGNPVQVQPGIWEIVLLDASGRNPAVYRLHADYDSGL